MTKRERYLKALRCEPVDQLVWAPNFDYWLHVNTAEGALPHKYHGMSRNDIVRAIGGTIWNRVGGARTVRDPRVRESRHEEPGVRVHELHTPLGTIRQVHRATEGLHRTWHLSEHFVKNVATMRVMQYVVEATHYEPDYAPVHRALDETGEDGIVLHQVSAVPFVEFAKTHAGYMDAFYLWTDHRREVDALVAAQFRNSLELYRVLAEGPADMISAGDNMDGVMISPGLFREYALPFYRAAKEICAARGKLFTAHWCGRTGTLLSLTVGSGLDGVEAIVTKPMDNLDLSAALDMLQGKVSLQGGIPSVLLCPQGGSREAFEAYIRQVIRPLSSRRGFILGLGDNTPPNADFARVESVATLVA